MANRLLRLDERAADVVIADKPHLHREPGLFRVSNSRADARVRNRHHDIGLSWGLARQDSPELGAYLVDALPEYVAVRPREVHVLEHAMRQRLWGERLDGSQAAVADDQHLARLD